MAIYVKTYSPKNYDIWFAAAPYGATSKPAKTLPVWASEENADYVFNLALFNMSGVGNDKYGVIKGRTLQYLRAKGVDCGYGGTDEKLTIDASNIVGGYKLAIKNNTVKVVQNSDKRSRNMNGLLSDGTYIHVQSDDGYTEYDVAKYINDRYNVSLLLIQDAGGSTSRYDADSKFYFHPEGIRAVCSVVCIKKKATTTTPVAPVSPVAKKVFIGVGHGGSDPGASANGLIEKTVNLNMALALRDELVRHGVQVKMSREKDEDDTVAQEVSECNAYNPDLAVEVHNNSGGGKGFEVFVYPGSTTGNKLATNIETEVKAIGQTSRGVKTTTSFMWVRSTNAPAVLCEGFFLDGTDHTMFKTEEAQRGMGVAYAKGVLKTLGITHVPAVVVKTNRDIAQERFGFDDATMKFLDGHSYPDALYEKLATKI